MRAADLGMLNGRIPRLQRKRKQRAMRRNMRKKMLLPYNWNRYAINVNLLKNYKITTQNLLTNSSKYISIN